MLSAADRVDRPAVISDRLAVDARRLLSASVALWALGACSSSESPVDRAPAEAADEATETPSEDLVTPESPAENEPASDTSSDPEVPVVLVPEEPEEEITEEPEPGQVTEETACTAVASRAEVTRRPVDIVLLVDNSGSMGEEIAAVERNINVNFSLILGASGLDYRVILFSGYRPGGQLNDSNPFEIRVCVDAPLGPDTCFTRSETVSPHREPQFWHFDQAVRSMDGACQLIDSLHRAPPFSTEDPLLQGGWAPLTRPEAFKSLIVLGDDDISCVHDDTFYSRGSFGDQTADAVAQTAEDLDALMRTSAPEVFGALAEQRNYTWHSIVGIQSKDDPKTAWEPEEELNNMTCPTAVNSGMVHQGLSRLTGGLRYSVCNVDSYDVVFQRVANQIIEDSRLPCSWGIPNAPAGEVLDPDRLNLAYQPGDGSAAPELGRVDGAEQCQEAQAWYYDDLDDPSEVRACPALCSQLALDSAGSVDVLFGCETRQPIAR